MSDQAHQKPEQAQAGKTRGKRSILNGLLMLPVVVVLFPSCIVLAAGMIPSLVAFFVDRTKGRHLTVTVALLNFCGTLPGLTKLWQGRQSLDLGLRLATDPVHWLASYSAAAGGWLIFLCLPPILAIFYSSTTSKRIEHLRRKQMNLIEIWGPEVVPGDITAPPED